MRLNMILSGARTSLRYFLVITTVCCALLTSELLYGQSTSAGTAAQGPVAASSFPAALSAQDTKDTNFFSRFITFYREDWTGTTPASDAAPRRGLPSPLSSPPFSSSDWSYGGSPTIGEADGNVYPLQTAINEAKGRTKVYGWIEPTADVSTSRDRNYPETNDIYSNRVELGQVVLYVERLPDSVQTDHVDWGYHVTGLFGTAYR